MCDAEPIEPDGNGDVALVEFLVVTVVVILVIVIATRIEQALNVGRFEARKDRVEVDGLPLAGNFFEFVEIDRGKFSEPVVGHQHGEFIVLGGEFLIVHRHDFDTEVLGCHQTAVARNDQAGEL